MGTLEHRRKARGLAASVARSIKGGRHLANVYGYTRPSGYQTVTVEGETFKVRYPIEPNPAEAPAVERAYEMRADDGASWQTIADELIRALAFARWRMDMGKGPRNGQVQDLQRDSAFRRA
jgi:hypothetical protein